MSDPAKKKANYSDLCSVPENMTGEIIDGELFVTPRPSVEHALASSLLGAELIPPYYHGRGGGPGGWVILDEPEIGFGANILQYAVSYFWLIEPVARTLEVFRLESGRWVLLGAFSDEDRVRAEPFQEMEIGLGGLWLEAKVS